ncbi:MAG: ABC transporter substrate-binding protein [Pseudonocardiaceae bacterium]
MATTHYDYEKDRSRLEQIATVLGPTTTADKETWQQTTMRVGEAVGRANEARRLVENTEATLASVRTEHPDWAGRTFTTGPVTPGEQLYTVSSTDDVSAALLQQLGLVLSPEVTALPVSDTAGRANVSLEQLSDLGLLDGRARQAVAESAFASATGRLLEIPSRHGQERLSRVLAGRGFGLGNDGRLAVRAGPVVVAGETEVGHPQQRTGQRSLAADASSASIAAHLHFVERGIACGYARPPCGSRSAPSASPWRASH